MTLRVQEHTYNPLEMLRESAKTVQKLLPPTEKQNSKLDLIEVTEHDITMSKIRAMQNPREYRDYIGLKPGKFLRLLVNGRTMMSNTPMEVNTNSEFIQHANGHVFVAGLGIGLILKALQVKSEVTSVMVMEKETSVMEMVWDKLGLDDRFKVFNGDVFTTGPNMFTPKMFDTVYFDIWPDVCGDYWEQVKQLKRKYRAWMNKDNPDKWIGAWREEDFKYYAKH
jgi:hypothetical protein